MIGTQFLANNVFKNILVIASEITSRGANTNDKNTFMLLGDGAGAAILTKNNACAHSFKTKVFSKSQRGIISHYFRADGERWDYATVLAGGSRYPEFFKDEDISKYLFSMKGIPIYKLSLIHI